MNKESKSSRGSSKGKKTASTVFDQRGQQVGQQTNIAGDMNVDSMQNTVLVGEEIHFGSATNREEVIADIEKLKVQVEKLLAKSGANEETVTDAKYQMEKAVQQSKNPEADRNKVLEYLDGAKKLISGLAEAGILVKVFIEAAQAVQKFF